MSTLFQKMAPQSENTLSTFFMIAARMRAENGFKSAEMRATPLESPGRTKPTNFATRHRLVIPSLTLLPGHGIKSSRFLLNVLATALGAFRVYFVFLQGENYLEGFVTIVANVVVHGHRGLPLDCDHELRLEL
jgi:hypothetical protein